MPQTIIYDSISRVVLVIDPLLDDQGQPILPVGLPTAAAATLSDTECAKFSTPSARFTLAADDATVTVTAVSQPPDLVLQQRVADAVTLLNSSIATQSQANRDALARTIGVEPLVIPLTQLAGNADIAPRPAA